MNHCIITIIWYFPVISSVLKCLDQLSVLNMKHKLEKLDKPGGADDNHPRVSVGPAEAHLETLAIIFKCSARVEEEIPAGRRRASDRRKGRRTEGWKEVRPVRLALVPGRVLCESFTVL